MGNIFLCLGFISDRDPREARMLHRRRLWRARIDAISEKRHDHRSSCKRLHPKSSRLNRDQKDRKRNFRCKNRNKKNHRRIQTDRVRTRLQTLAVLIADNPLRVLFLAQTRIELGTLVRNADESRQKKLSIAHCKKILNKDGYN